MKKIITILIATFIVGGAIYASETKIKTYQGASTPSFSYATSTAWSSTTTIPLGVAMFAETFDSIACFTDAGSLDVSFHDGTNRANIYKGASTTVSEMAFTANNTFTVLEKRYVDIGNPANSPTKISCTFKK